MVFLLKFMLSYLETCHNFSYNKLITCIGLPLYMWHRINMVAGINLLNGGKFGLRNGSAVVLMVVRRAARCSSHAGAKSTLILALVVPSTCL
ncbi:hypothetical protein AAG906_016585 [Vitis piasezkii]